MRVAEGQRKKRPTTLDTQVASFLIMPVAGFNELYLSGYKRERQRDQTGRYIIVGCTYGQLPFYLLTLSRTQVARKHATRNYLHP